MKNIIKTLGLIAFLILPFSAFSQEIKANVTVILDQLTFENRTNVTQMENDVEAYINNQKFTRIEWEGEPIPVEITIVLSGGTRNLYGGRLMVVSKRVLDGPEEEAGESVALKMLDSRWSFEYGLGANLTYNPMRFDAFTSLIDYYMLLVIGFDLDSYNELSGSEVFEQAKSIIQLGASNSADGYSTFSQPGEFTRFNLVSELTDMRYYDLRKIFFSYYYDVLDQMAFDKEKAMKSLEFVILDLANFKKDKMVGPSVLLQAFFDSKAEEIAYTLKSYPNEDVFLNLKYVDPSNTILYDDAKAGK
jgi:hypothetical protein